MKKIHFKKSIPLILITLILLCSGCTKEKDTLLDDVTDNILQNLTVMDSIIQQYEFGLHYCDEYIDNNVSDDNFETKFSEFVEEIKKQKTVLVSDDLDSKINNCEKYPEPLSIAGYVAQVQCDFVQNLEYLYEYLMISKSVDDNTELHRDIESYREEYILDTELVWYNVNSYLLSFNKNSSIENMCKKAGKLSYFSEVSEYWSSSAEELTAQIEFCFKRYEELINEKSRIVGDKNSAMKAEKEQLIQQYMQYYNCSKEEAEELLGSILDLERAREELEKSKQELIEKFSPVNEDNSAELFSKAAHFCAAGMYDQAIECIQFFMNRNDDPEMPKICGETAIAFYNSVAEIGINYGIMVTTPDEATMAYYKPGDIIISINSEKIFSIESYSNTSSIRNGNGSYETTLLRLNSNMKLEKVVVSIPCGTLGFYGNVMNSAESIK